ncbi:MAG: hypothetical protein EKK34_10425 [Mycobacterium sp.]|nr:MAG: hypothetical protein EKK34_10425 [Mycobacterium sp.]
MELRARDWSIVAAGREVGVSLTSARRRGHSRAARVTSVKWATSGVPAARRPCPGHGPLLSGPCLSCGSRPCREYPIALGNWWCRWPRSGTHRRHGFG